MRKTVIAGNWKMNKTLSESVELISGLKNAINDVEINCDVIICPPFTNLETASTLLKDTVIKLGAQNMHFEDSGAFTGEISANMLLSVGVEYVILGHSERRAIFGETNEMINKKVRKAIESGLKPILCVGETLEERESGTMKNVIESQVKGGLQNISAGDMEKIIIAYEPVWAIGTGKTASPEQAQEVHEFIRGLLAELYSNEIAENSTIQYGGSVKPENAATLLSMNDIDGALVGGACLKAESFAAIIKSA